MQFKVEKTPDKGVGLSKLMQASVLAMFAGMALIIVDIFFVNVAKQSLLGTIGEWVMAGGYGGFLAIITKTRKCLLGIDISQLPKLDFLQNLDKKNLDSECQSRIKKYEESLDSFHLTNKFVLTPQEKFLRLSGAFASGAGVIMLLVADSKTVGSFSALLAILGISPYKNAISELEHFLKGCEKARKICLELAKEWEKIQKACFTK